jgi:hypothetical protein
VDLVGLVDEVDLELRVHVQGVARAREGLLAGALAGLVVDVFGLGRAPPGFARRRRASRTRAWVAPLRVLTVARPSPS